MKKLLKSRSAVLLAVLLILALICMITANSIQHSGGKVSIEDGSISSPYGDLTYKLYIPDTATEQSKAPGVLLLHGYQNDHETCALMQLSCHAEEQLFSVSMSTGTDPLQPDLSTEAGSITK